MKQSEWLEIAARISALWPHQPMSKPTAAAGWDLLSRYPAAEVLAAVHLIAVSGERFPPTPGQIVARIVKRSGIPWQRVGAPRRDELSDGTVPRIEEQLRRIGSGD